MKLKIYSIDGILKLTVAPENNNAESLGIQEESTLALSFTGFECIPLEVYDYAEFQGRRYWVTERYIPKMNTSKEWKYSVSLFGVEGLAAQTLMVNPSDDDNPVVTLMAPAREHATLIVANLNRKMQTTDWKVGEVVVSEYINIEYTGKYASDALSELSEAAGTEWWFDGMTLNISRCEFGEPIPLSYGNGLLGGISRTTADGVKFFTRLFPVGSSRNIDVDYYGHARLQLPDGAKYVEQDTHLGIVEHYEQVAFENIYPRRVGQVGIVRHEEVMGDDGKPFTIYYFTDPDIPFNPNEYEIGGLVKRITFQSGELRGHEFEVNYDTAKKEFEIITQWPYDDDLQLPSEPLIPVTGDEYILWNIRMPESYYPAAEQEYKEVVDQFMADNRKDISIYQASTDFTVVERRAIELRPGQRIRLESAEAFPDTGFCETRIISISRSIVRPGSMTLKMSDVLSTGRINRIENNLTSVERLTKQVSTEFPDLIRSWEETPASDTTVYTSRKCEKEFLNKQRGGVVLEDVTFNKDVKIGEAVISKDFRQGDFSGSGFGLYRDANGNAVAEVDIIKARKEAIFNEAIINQVTFQIGATVFSNGGCEIARIEELDDRYRCYYDTKDGRRICGLVVDDQVRCQRYDNAQHTIIKYYWRLVIAVGEDYVDLSKTDVDGSGITEVGDEIAQFGNRSDKTRQSAIVINPQNGGSVEVYAHIDSYQLSEKNYVGMGVNPNTGEAYMYAYGDVFYGDRDISALDSNFITYQKAEGDNKRKLRISANVQIGSGSSGLTNLSEWSSKQQQIDVATEMAENAQNKVDSIQIGGVNLQRNSNFSDSYDLADWSGFQSYYVISMSSNRLTVVTTKNGSVGGNERVTGFCYEILSGKIAISFDVWSKDHEEANVTIRVFGANASTNVTRKISNTKTRVSAIINAGDVTYSQWAFAFDKIGTFYVENVMVEKASTSSQWQLAPQEVQMTIEEAKKAAAEATYSIESLKNFTDIAFTDGIVDRAESAAIEKYINSVNETKDAVDATYETVYNNTLLSGTAKSNLQSAKSSFDTAVADLLASIQTASSDGIATSDEKNDVDAKYSTFNTSYASFSTRIEEAQKYIQTVINTTAQGAYQLSQELQDAVNNLNEFIIPDLQSQIDKQIVSYNGTDVPTLENYPANEWQDDTERARHINDYYDRKISGDDGEVSYERYKFTKESGVYKWVRIADSGVAEAQAKAIEALGVANGKNKVYFGDSTPYVPYIINDLWIKTSGDIYISNADRSEGATGTISDWQLVNDAQLRLRQMSSDNVISKEEKASLRNQLDQLHKEYASYQSDATTYGVSIASLQTAYTNLTTFLTGTVSVNNDIDTTLTTEQRASYNTYFAKYYAEVSRFTNIVADAIAQNKVDTIQIGGVNLQRNSNFSDSYDLADWSGFQSYYVISMSSNRLTVVTTKNGSVGGNERVTGFCYEILSGKIAISFDVWSKDHEEANVTIRVFGANASTNVTRKISNTKTRVSAIINAGDVTYSQWAFAFDKIGTFYVENVMVEKASSPSQWRLAPQEVQMSIDEAKKAAEEAITNASNAFKEVQSITEELNIIQSDNYISPTEKTALKQQYADVQSEYLDIILNANRYDIETTSFTNSYQAANLAFIKYTASDPENIPITSDFSSVENYYTARQTILNDIATAALKYVDDKQLESYNEIASNLGYDNWVDMVNKAIDGETIISGGYIRTSLIDTDNLTAKNVISKDDKFQILSDGTMKAIDGDFSGTISATSGKIGGFDIDGNTLTSNNDQSSVIFDRNSIFASIGNNTEPAFSGITIPAKFKNSQNKPYDENVAVFVSAKGGNKNHAIYIDSGTVTGFALPIREVSSSGNINKNDGIILCNNSAEITLYLPQPSSTNRGKILIVKLVRGAGVKLSCATTSGGGLIYTNAIVTNTYIGNSNGGAALLFNDGNYWNYNYLGL